MCIRKQFFFIVDPAVLIESKLNFSEHCKWIIVSHFLVPILATHRLHERFVWSVIDYAFISEEEKSQAVATGRYIAANNMPLGIEVWKDKLFVSVPRWKPGSNQI